MLGKPKPKILIQHPQRCIDTKNKIPGTNSQQRVQKDVEQHG